MFSEVASEFGVGLPRPWQKYETGHGGLAMIAAGVKQTHGSAEKIHSNPTKWWSPM